MSTPPVTSEAGETLLELLISIAIVGIAVTALLGGLRMAVQGSTLDERQVHAQALLRSWGEHVVSATTDDTYVACATPGTYSAAPWAYTSPTPPAGLQPLPDDFTAEVTSVEYLTSPGPAGTAGFGSSCPTDYGVQRVELTMRVADAQQPGFDATYEVVVRRPCETVGASGC